MSIPLGIAAVLFVASIIYPDRTVRRAALITGWIIVVTFITLTEIGA